jgi:uncharacterized protein (TIGR00297 family)
VKPRLEPLWVAVIVLALLGLSVLAYALRALDMMGAVVSFFVGLEVALLGGLSWLLLMVVFTAMGFAATRVGYRRKKDRRVAEPGGGERGAQNVLGNGLAPALAALAVPLAPLVPLEASALAFATAVAAVAADTLASELGVLARTARRVIPPFTPEAPGRNGAVSLPGQAAALAASAAIAIAAALLMGIPWGQAWIPLVGGFLGCQVDSVLGATLERDIDRDGPLSKQDVNFLSSAIPAFAVLVAASFAL